MADENTDLENLPQSQPASEALRLKSLAEEKYAAGNLKSALKYAERAHSLNPAQEGVPEMLTALEILRTAGKPIAPTPSDDAAAAAPTLPDYYKVLQIERFAHINTIKKQYKKLALQLHPDKNPFAASEEAFKYVGEGFRVLSDKIRRKVYDMRLRIAMQNEAEAGGCVAEFGAGEIDAFWTACSTCRLLHKFERKYLGRNLVCPRCKKSFKAVEAEGGENSVMAEDEEEKGELELSSRRIKPKRAGKMSSIGDLLERSSKDNVGSGRKGVKKGSKNFGKKRGSKASDGGDLEMSKEWSAKRVGMDGKIGGVDVVKGTRKQEKSLEVVEEEVITLAEMQMSMKKKVNDEKKLKERRQQKDKNEVENGREKKEEKVSEIGKEMEKEEEKDKVEEVVNQNEIGSENIEDEAEETSYDGENGKKRKTMTLAEMQMSMKKKLKGRRQGKDKNEVENGGEKEDRGKEKEKDKEEEVNGKEIENENVEEVEAEETGYDGKSRKMMTLAEMQMSLKKKLKEGRQGQDKNEVENGSKKEKEIEGREEGKDVEKEEEKDKKDEVNEKEIQNENMDEEEAEETGYDGENQKMRKMMTLAEMQMSLKKKLKEGRQGQDKNEVENGGKKEKEIEDREEGKDVEKDKEKDKKDEVNEKEIQNENMDEEETEETGYDGEKQKKKKMMTLAEMQMLVKKKVRYEKKMKGKDKGEVDKDTKKGMDRENEMEKDEEEEVGQENEIENEDMGEEGEEMEMVDEMRIGKDRKKEKQKLNKKTKMETKTVKGEGNRERKRVSNCEDLTVVKNWTSRCIRNLPIKKRKRSRQKNMQIVAVYDSDFYEFDKERKERSFKKGQVWAIYDSEDGMPRHYALIDEVLSVDPFEVRLSWLEFQSNGDHPLISWEKLGFYVACGRFKVSEQATVKYLKMFSHLASCERAAREVYRIYPKKGSIWALYNERALDSERSNQTTKDKICYDLVVFLTSYSDIYGTSMAHLEKVDGFKTIFKRREIGAHAVRLLEKDDIKLLSHEIPGRKLSGEDGLPKDCWELDPTSLPAGVLTTDWRDAIPQRKLLRDT